MGANGAQAVRHHSWGNLNLSRTAKGITKWFWVTIEGYLSYFLPKFEDFVFTGLGSGALYIHARTYTLYPVYALGISLFLATSDFQVQNGHLLLLTPSTPSSLNSHLRHPS